MQSFKLASAFGAVIALSLLSAPASAERFGSKLTRQTQPANAEGGRFCDDPDGAPHPVCTWVMTDARNNPDGHKAPHDGKIAKIRLIACQPGKFELFLARIGPEGNEAKVLRSGGVIEYEGDSNNCQGSRFDIESFPVDVRVKKGEVLAIKTKRTSSLYCAGDNGVLRFDPPLKPGQDYRPALEEDSCLMLLEAEYK